MKLAITGKGGVGKTTVSSLLAKVFAEEGKRVLAIDANPDSNLGNALGISQEDSANIVPVSEMKELIEERTGATIGVPGGYFKMNPRVDDIPERYAIKVDGIWFMVLGTVKSGGMGCICPESAVLRSLVSHLILGQSDIVIMDMDAGIEHLGRGTARGIDAFISVVEPGQRAVQTANSVKNLASDLGVNKFYVIGSKVRDDTDRKYIVDNVSDSVILGYLSYHPDIAMADREGISVFKAAPKAVEEMREIKSMLEQIYMEARGEEKGP